MLQDYQIKTLMLVYELEKSLSDLYIIFKERFPEHNILWETLIKEEYEHAEAVRKLYRLTYEKQVLFKEGNIKPEGVQSVIDYLKTICNNAKQGQYTAKQALSLAYDIEKSLIEKNIFNHFNVAPQLANLLSFLIIGTKNHIELVKQELDNFQ